MVVAMVVLPIKLAITLLLILAAVAVELEHDRLAAHWAALVLMDIV
jgi:hypothetical protein